MHFNSHPCFHLLIRQQGCCGHIVLLQWYFVLLHQLSSDIRNREMYEVNDKFLWMTFEINILVYPIKLLLPTLNLPSTCITVSFHSYCPKYCWFSPLILLWGQNSALRLSNSKLCQSFHILGNGINYNFCKISNNAQYYLSIYPLALAKDTCICCRGVWRNSVIPKSYSTQWVKKCSAQ